MILCLTIPAWPTSAQPSGESTQVKIYAAILCAVVIWHTVPHWVPRIDDVCRSAVQYCSAAQSFCVACSEQAVVKSYSISVGGSSTKVDRFVAYMVPAEEFPSREANGNTQAERRAMQAFMTNSLMRVCLQEFPTPLMFAYHAPSPCSSQERPLYEGQYEWVREYTYSVQNEQAGGSHSYVFRFAPDAVRYLDLGTRLTVQKRSKLKDKDSLQSHRFARPAEVGFFTDLVDTIILMY